MPVTRICASVDWSIYSGAGWWIARVSVAWIGPASSTGSPITLMMRPSISGPTGTEIGAPVSATDWPRTRPSVESMAMQRTVFSPRCCATSSTRRLPWLSVSSAFRIAGKLSSKATSTTAPMTWRTRPVAPVAALRGAALVLAAAFAGATAFFAAAALGAAAAFGAAAAALAGAFLGVAALAIVNTLFSRSCCSRARRFAGASRLERLGARDDLDQFLGDLRLALAVVGDRQLVDHVAGIARRIVHRRHLGAHLAGRVLQKRPEDLHRDVARDEVGEDFSRLGLV